MHKYTRMHTLSLSPTHSHTHKLTRAHTHAHTHTHKHKYTRMHANTCMHTHALTHACTLKHTHTQTCIHTRSHTHAHTHTHTHSHTNMTERDSVPESCTRPGNHRAVAAAAELSNSRIRSPKNASAVVWEETLVPVLAVLRDLGTGSTGKLTCGLSSSSLLIDARAHTSAFMHTHAHAQKYTESGRARHVTRMNVN